MDTRRLSYFIRIAEDGSLTKASGVLRIAQPALSRQMRLLEEELGVALFHRTARGMRLTEDGEYLRGAVAGPLRELELALQNIGARNGAAEANFAVGMSQNLAEALGAPLAFGLRTRFPNVQFCIVDGLTGSLIDWLGRGIVDFAVLEETGHDEQLSELPLASLKLSLVGPAKAAAPAISSLAGKTVTLAAALQLPLVLTSHHLGLRSLINEAAARLKIKPDVRIQADSSRLIRELVKDGVGYSILPDCYVQAEADGLKTWPIAAPGLSLDVVLSSRKNSTISGRQFSDVERAIAQIAGDILSPSPKGKVRYRQG